MIGLDQQVDLKFKDNFYSRAKNAFKDFVSNSKT